MTDTRYRYAIIGTGRPWKEEGATGFGMAHSHGPGFFKTDRVDLVALADLNEEVARYFLEKHEQQAALYTDYHTMLAEEKPDIVSICTWPHLHAEMTVAACEAGVRAIHCEKPMATTWGDAKRMKAAAEASGTVLTFNHQRRFLEPFQRAKTLLTEGAIGEITLLEAECSDLYDWGTHWLNMMFYLNNETPAEWVIGQIDCRKERKIFGADVEDQGVAYWKWQNGVRGLMVTGFEAKLGDVAIRVTGTKGGLEVLWNKPCLRLRTDDQAEWQVLETEEGLHDGVAIDRACADLVRALDEPGYQPMLCAANTLRATEVIFATYESSRKRGRVDLPLTADDNAFFAMLADGSVGPNRQG